MKLRVAVAMGLMACGPEAKAPSGAPLGPLPPAKATSTSVFEGEIELARSVLEGPEGVEMLGPPELRRDVLRAAPGKVRASACAMGAGCGYEIVDRSQDRLWIVFEQHRVVLEHDLTAFRKLMKQPLAAPPDDGTPKDPREWSKIEATTKRGEVAGVPCEEVVQTTGYGGRWEACLTRAPEFAELIAHFAEIGATGHVYMGFRPFVSAGWFPLRIVTVLPGLKTEVRAVRITRKTMANGLFVVPPDYKVERVTD